MASSSPQNKVSEITEITALASELHTHISQATTSSNLSLSLNDNILQRLERYLDEFPLLSRVTPSISSRRDLDSKGTELWNACARTMSMMSILNTPVQEKGRICFPLLLLCKVNVFAFWMLEVAAGNQGDSRVLTVALKAARVCLDNEELELGLKILETAASRLDTLGKSGSDVPVQSFTMEYYMLRVYLSWLQGRPDIAELMFSKVPRPDSKECREIMLEICYNVGKSASASGQYGLASKWLERAVSSNELLNHTVTTTIKQSATDADMALLVLYTLARAYLQTNTTDSLNRLSQVMDALKTDYENVFAVSLLQLEVLRKGTSPNIHDYYNCLKIAFQSMDLSDENLKIILFYILKLKDWSLELSLQALQQLLLHDITRLDSVNWVEQILVTLVWLLTDLAFCPQDGLDRLTDTLVELSKSWQGHLTKEATHACLILIWRKVDYAISKGDYYIAGRWCQVASEHQIFRKRTAVCKAKFQRRLMICAVENSDRAIALETWNHMPEECQSDPLTLYLRYKLALLGDDLVIATACQDSLSQLGSPGTDYMLACVAEARGMGKMRQVIAGNQLIISNLKGHGYEGINMSGIFQTTLHFLSMELENYACASDNAKIMEQIAGIYEAEARCTSRSHFKPVDLEWLSRNSYDTALRSLKKASWEVIMRLLDVSMKFIDCHQQKLDANSQLNADRHFLLCNFLKSITLLTQARMQKTLYPEVRICTQDFHARVSSLKESITETERLDWAVKHRLVLSFDFEAAASLGQWDVLASIVERARGMMDNQLASTFMDYILSSEAPVIETVRVVQKIITTSTTATGTTSGTMVPSFLKKLPRYLRCLFQLCITEQDKIKNTDTDPASDSNSEIEQLAESILDHALTLTQQQPRDDGYYCYNYPDEELEWLATVAFNHAVDLYLASAEADCKRWAGKAIELADLIGDRGKRVFLSRLLRDNLMKLVRGYD